MGNSLVVHWLRLHASSMGALGLIPGWETKIPHAMWHGQKMDMTERLSLT